MKDESSSYREIGPHYWQHRMVNHGLSEYGRREQSGQRHTNIAENFFSIFKRGVIGTDRHMSKVHLHRYCREFDSAITPAP